VSNVSYTSGFICVLAAFLLLPLTLGTIFAQSNDRCAQALSHEIILKRIKDIPKDRIDSRLIINLIRSEHNKLVVKSINSTLNSQQN
jgi:hypothetical protein